MPRRKPTTWTDDDVVAALRSIKVDGLSVKGAARAHGVPTSTLRDKFHGRVPVFAIRGRCSYLSQEEEQKIVDWAKKMGSIGLRQTPNDIKNVVKTLIEKDGRVTPFLNNTPGSKWWRTFRKRHPELVYRDTKQLNKVCVTVPDERVELWFNEFEARMQNERAFFMLTDSERHHEEESLTIDKILGSISAAKSTPSTPGQAQSAQSTPSTLPHEAVLTEPLPTEVVYTPQGKRTYKYPPSKEYLAALPGMSQDQRKKKGLPPTAITVAEFFSYIRSRKNSDIQEQKRIDRRKMREKKQREKEKEMEEEMNNDMNNDDDSEAIDAAHQVMMLSEEGEEISEVTVATTPPVLQFEKKQERSLILSKAEIQQKNRAQAIEIMNSVYNVDTEAMRKEQMTEMQITEMAKKKKAKIDKAKKAMQSLGAVREKHKEKVKKSKQLKKKGIKKRKDQKQKGGSKKKRRKEKLDYDADESRNEVIIEAKDKVRTVSNIKTVTNDQEIYVCPACLKSSGDDEKWIRCDHCVRWLHLSCTSMHLLRGIDLAGFDYRCKFC